MGLFILTDQNGQEEYLEKSLQPKDSFELKENFKQLPVAEPFIWFGNRSVGLADDPVRAHILFEVIVYSILFVIGAFR